MNKFIATAGVAVVGTAALQAANDAGLTPAQKGKLWSVSATLRGFYDDNHTTSPDKLAEESFGFEVSPDLGLNWVGDQTRVSVGYKFGLRYYDDREGDSEDYGHEIGASLNHDFKTGSLSLTEHLRVAQEPEVLDPQLSRPLRTEGDNVANTVGGKLDYSFGAEFFGRFGYNNRLFEYDDNNYSVLLDRMEHLASAELFWQASSQTAFSLGYKYGVTDFDGGEQQVVGLNFVADARDNRSHYVHLGAIHQIAEYFWADLNVGMQYADFHNHDKMPGLIPDDEDSHFVEASLKWEYLEDSTLKLGAFNKRGATDLQAADQETTGVYLEVNHPLTPRIMGELTGMLLDSNINGGGDGVDDMDETIGLFGINLAYSVSEWVVAEIGYNFDELDSDITRTERDFDRNRVYVGLRAEF